MWGDRHTSKYIEEQRTKNRRREHGSSLGCRTSELAGTSQQPLENPLLDEMAERILSEALAMQFKEQIAREKAKNKVTPETPGQTR